jgi:hypothetical protein
MDSSEKESVEDIVGDALTIKFCHGAQVSLEKSVQRVAPTQKRKKIIASTRALLVRLSNGQRLAADSLVQEGKLPDGKSFKALKKLPIRCYFWSSSSHKNIIFVSHYVYKDYKKLAQKDIDLVCHNWHLEERK